MDIPQCKPSDMVKIMEVAAKNGLNFMVIGSPGVGKTDLIYEAARNTDHDVILSHPVVDDPVDYKGMPFVITDENGHQYAVFLPFGNLLKAIDAKKPTIYFMDDLGQAAPAVQAAAMQLLLAREINGKKVSNDITFMAASNKKSDRSGVTGMLEAVKSRFKSIIELIVDKDDWTQWALRPENNIPTELIAFIRFRPALLNDFQPTSDMTQSPCPRTIANVASWMNAGLQKHLEHRVFAGAIGMGAATELTAFLKIARSLPNIDKILMDPENAIVPDMNSSNGPATMYALCGALARRASEQNMGNFIKYANRLPEEFSVFTVRDAIKINEDLSSTRPFIEWVSDHKEVLT